MDGGNPRWAGGNDGRRVRGQIHAALEFQNFSEEAAAEKAHGGRSCSTISGSRLPGTAVLSVITRGGKWVKMTISADPLYQHLLLTAERKFWRCVQSGEPPRLFGIEPPRFRLDPLCCA